MADPIAWGMIDEVGEKVGGVGAKVDDIGPKIDNINKNVGAIAGDVENTLNTGMNTWTQSINKAVQDLKAETTEMHEVVNAAPVGIPAPSLQYIDAHSTASGIVVEYKANFANIGADKHEVLAQTKGVMVRYSSVAFPKNKEEGTLAFTDEDLFDVDAIGNCVAKTKQKSIIGLSNGTTYYIAAFPYSTYNTYNESIGDAQCAKCAYSATKGNLIVDVTSDFEYKPLGAYSATLKPASGGELITKQATGAAKVVFNSLDAGNYELSFSDTTHFDKPAKKTIAIVAGQTKKEAAQFRQALALSDCDFTEISEIAASGHAADFFFVGASKLIRIGGEDLTLEIAAFNHDDLPGGGKAPITFVFRNLLTDVRQMNPTNTNVGGFTGSQMYRWLQGDFLNSLPADLRAAIKMVNKKTSAGNQSSTIKTEPMKCFLLSEKEVGLQNYSAAGEGATYSLFTTTSKRIKKLANGAGEASIWWLRSPYASDSGHFCCVSTYGNADGYSAGSAYGVCVGFCI